MLRRLNKFSNPSGITAQNFKVNLLRRLNKIKKSFSLDEEKCYAGLTNSQIQVELQHKISNCKLICYAGLTK
jgi:hypothetical protein